MIVSSFSVAAGKFLRVEHPLSWSFSLRLCASESNNTGWPLKRFGGVLIQIMESKYQVLSQTFKDNFFLIEWFYVPGSFSIFWQISSFSVPFFAGQVQGFSETSWTSCVVKTSSSFRQCSQFVAYAISMSDLIHCYKTPRSVHFQ